VLVPTCIVGTPNDLKPEVGTQLTKGCRLLLWTTS